MFKNYADLEEVFINILIAAKEKEELMCFV
jgi:hypothetical protein